MLKTRVIGVVLVRDGIAVQSIGFARYLPIGRPEVVIEYLNQWGIDEIVVLHMDATPNRRSPTVDDVARYAKHCQVPLAVGGGIKDAATVKHIIQGGADKIVINTAAILRPAIIEEAASLFGNQCVVASIDARRVAGSYRACLASASQVTDWEVGPLADALARRGAGEILINSVERDGSKSGYELPLLSAVVANVAVPVIACGGAGHPRHMVEAMRTGVSAVAAANFFNYCEHSVTLVKRYLVAAQAPVRLDGHLRYADSNLDADARLAKQSDAALDALRFRYVAEEVI